MQQQERGRPGSAAGDPPFAALLEHLPVAVFVLDGSGRPVYVNRASHRLLGKGIDPDSPWESLAETYHACVAGTEEPYPVLRLPVVRALAGETASVDDVEIVTPAGRVPLEVWAGPVRNAEGGVAYAVAAFQDITARRQAEEENARLYQEVTRHNRWLDAVREVLCSILARTDPDQTLERAAMLAGELAGADVAIIATHGPGGSSLVIQAAVGSHADELRRSAMPVEGSVLGDVVRLGKTVVLEDAAADPRTAGPFVRLGFGPALYVPLSADGRAIGGICLARRRGAPAFGDHEVRLAETFADNAAVAVEYGRAQRELARLAVVDDRERIAKDLHDGVIQSLFAVGMGLSAATAMTTDPELGGRIEGAIDELDGVIRDVRNYIFSLRSGVLAGRHVGDAVRSLAEDFQSKTGVLAVVDVDLGVAACLSSQAGDVVHLVREGLSNVGRHAGATTCRVGLVRRGGNVVLEIDDDGRGFELEQVRDRGQGLANLEARASALQGTMEIDTAPGEGTTLRVVLPA